jgi:hypothetical protein
LPEGKAAAMSHDGWPFDFDIFCDADGSHNDFEMSGEHLHLVHPRDIEGFGPAEGQLGECVDGGFGGGGSSAESSMDFDLGSIL